MAEFQTNLWAPWRMEYIAGLGAMGDGCFICAAQQDPSRDAENHVLWRGPRTITLLNLFPYSSGHVLVAPTEHRGNPEQFADDTLLELMQHVRDIKRVLERALHAQGFNIGINLGRCAGAGLPEHMHMHVVPRWAGDVNFMAVLGDVKVIPQSLVTVRRLVLDAAGELGVLAPTGH